MKEVSGYQPYSKKQKSLIIKNWLPEFYPPFPDKNMK